MVMYQTSDLDPIVQSLDSVEITWVTGLGALVVLIGGIFIARLARRSILALGERTDLANPHMFKIAGRVASFGIMLYAIGAALGFLGFEVVPLLSALGIAVIILALGLRPLFENFAAGVTLQTRRPFEPDDEVSLLGTEGMVLDINARSVVVETRGGEQVHVPNRLVLENPITNYTAKGTRRSKLEVGLEYDTDLDRAASVMLTTVRETAGVNGEPAATVLVHTFDDSTINATIRFWHGPEISTAWAVRHEVAVNVKRSLDEAGITIAFPQRVLWWGDQPAKDLDAGSAG